jgi:OOP family OmpA-OmpF porin
MNRILTAVIFSLLLLPAIAQKNNAATKNPATLADVNVVVTDMKGIPSKGEQIIFRGEKAGKAYNGKSDAAGRFSLKLPAGDKYLITVKSLTDSSKYGVIDIPALGPDEFYTEPFTVNVKFEMAKNYTLDNVHFDFGKASLRPDSFKELDELVSFMKNKETIRIEIGGHTDNVGKDADNLKLSQQRAESVKNYLVKKGIAVARIMAKGYGASQPVADNAIDKGRQMNRRTVVRVL